MAASQIEVKLVRGLAGKNKDQIKVCHSLGLRRTNSTRIHEDSPVIRGMIAKVPHLVAVRETKGKAKKGSK
jgi:large subunit ribosomal protein L30